MREGPIEDGQGILLQYRGGSEDRGTFLGVCVSLQRGFYLGYKRGIPTVGNTHMRTLIRVPISLHLPRAGRLKIDLSLRQGYLSLRVSQGLQLSTPCRWQLVSVAGYK